MLKDRGWLWICEVRSRFAGQAEGAATPAAGEKSAAGDWVMLAFTKCLQQLGFKLAQKKASSLHDEAGLGCSDFHI